MARDEEPKKEITGIPRKAFGGRAIIRSPGCFAMTPSTTLREEAPDRVRPDDQPAMLIDDEPETGDGIDAELSDDEIYPAAEEAAVDVVEKPAGSTARSTATPARTLDPT